MSSSPNTALPEVVDVGPTWRAAPHHPDEPGGLPSGARASCSVTLGRVVVGEDDATSPSRPARSSSARSRTARARRPRRDPVGPRLDQRRRVPEPREVGANPAGHVGRRDDDERGAGGVRLHEDLDVAEVVVEVRGCRLAPSEDRGRVATAAASNSAHPSVPRTAPPGTIRIALPTAHGGSPCDLHRRRPRPTPRRPPRSSAGASGAGVAVDVAGGVRAGRPGQQLDRVRDAPAGRPRATRGRPVGLPGRFTHERVADVPGDARGRAPPSACARARPSASVRRGPAPRARSRRASPRASRPAGPNPVPPVVTTSRVSAAPAVAAPPRSAAARPARPRAPRRRSRRRAGAPRRARRTLVDPRALRDAVGDRDHRGARSAHLVILPPRGPGCRAG